MKASSSTRIPDIGWGGPLSVAWSLTDDDLLQLAIRHVKATGVEAVDFIVEVAAVLEALMDERRKWQGEFGGSVTITAPAPRRLDDARVTDPTIR